MREVLQVQEEASRSEVEEKDYNDLSQIKGDKKCGKVSMRRRICRA